MHFFVTGHTGFKGSWLILLLKELGHEVSGYSLAPVEGSLFQLASLEREVKHHFIGDIRDLDHLRSAMSLSQPDFAIHMAAQPLVLRSYEEPIETYTTNVDGTLNFLRAVTELDSPPISLVITTDKVYRDDGKGSYVETDPLGGHDPYSASKAMADILSQSWAATHPALKLHIARAGNVIGAFDVSPNRLIPDLIRSVKANVTLEVRHPNAVRPWQHVLDCLSGYLLLLEKSAMGHNVPLVMNFGPDAANLKQVSDVLEIANGYISELRTLTVESPLNSKETAILTLNSNLAQSHLSWRNRVGLELAVRASLSELLDEDLETSARQQVRNFLADSPIVN
jgi:CDP-glucose 4,6-dehydratase